IVQIHAENTRCNTSFSEAGFVFVETKSLKEVVAMMRLVGTCALDLTNDDFPFHPLPGAEPHQLRQQTHRRCPSYSGHAKLLVDREVAHKRRSAVDVVLRIEVADDLRSELGDHHDVVKFMQRR